MSMHVPIQAPSEYKRLALEYVDSTNTEAARMAKSGADEGLWVTSRQQANGRGRRGRVWSSLDGNLFASLLLRPNVKAPDAANLSFVASLAVYDVATKFLSRSKDVSVKWPNDVLVDGAKISGILLESSTKADGFVDHLIIGIGLNVKISPTGTPYKTTSLQENGSVASADEAMSDLMTSFEHWYDIWCEEGFLPIRKAWLERANHLGKTVSAKLTETSEIKGIFSDLAADGALILDVDGDMRHIHAGDIFPAQDG